MAVWAFGYTNKTQCSCDIHITIYYLMVYISGLVHSEGCVARHTGTQISFRETRHMLTTNQDYHTPNNYGENKSRVL